MRAVVYSSWLSWVVETVLASQFCRAWKHVYRWPSLGFFSLYNATCHSKRSRSISDRQSLLPAKKLSHTSNVLIGRKNFRPPSRPSSLLSSIPYRAIFLKTFHNLPYLSFWRQIPTVESSITPSKRPSDGSHGTGFVPLLYNKDSVLQVKNHWKRPKANEMGDK